MGIADNNPQALATESAEGTPAPLRVSSMVQPLYLREKASYLRKQAERCRRLARGSVDPGLRDSMLGLADEFAARAAVLQSGGTSIQNPGSDRRALSD